MFRPLLSAAFLLLLLAAPAQAAPINLLLTVDIYPPTSGPPEIGFTYGFSVLSHGQSDGLLFPGTTQISVSVEAASLDNVYFRAYGGWLIPQEEGEDRVGLYVAQPPNGYVGDSTIYEYGPPWIPLANLGGGVSGDLWWYYGYPRTANGVVGTWAISAAPDLAAVPEPASMLLLGSGLAAVAARKYRQSKAAPPTD